MPHYHPPAKLNMVSLGDLSAYLYFFSIFLGYISILLLISEIFGKKIKYGVGSSLLATRLIVYAESFR